MAPASHSRLMRLFFVAAAVAFLVIASLSGAMVQPRTILGWELEHFLAYFAATVIVSVALSRPWAVGGAMAVLGGVLELLQFLTPDRTPNTIAALCSAAGALAGALLMGLFMRGKNRRVLGGPDDSSPNQD